MSEHILIGVAWPYANGPLHLGHIAGAYLPADIFARYHRLKGNEVLMVSGSDMHGTPITIHAEQEGVSPREIANRYHQQFYDCWERMGISFDLYTNTETENHIKVTQDIFLTLLKKDYIYKDSMNLLYCPHCQRYLPDRYVEGKCPHCGYEGARGDQCDICGKPLNPLDLINPRCKLCQTTPEARESEHFFLRLSAFENKLLAWVKQQTHWRPDVLNFVTNYLKSGLKDRAITRDMEWGIPIPLPGFENKRIYVWFEAVIGYLSASMEWAQLQGKEDAWRPFWQGDGKTYYFIGKDNIPFHAIIWPAMLMGYGGLNLPFDVPANEFLTLEGKKFSTSRHWAVWLPDYLERYAADPLRYMLSANMPETGDADFSWSEWLRRNNNELVATYGNLVHRVLAITCRNFDNSVPPAGEQDERDKALLSLAENTLSIVDKALAQCHFREGIRLAMTLAQEGNRYLEEKSPWKTIKTDRTTTATTLNVALSIISCLKTILYPFIPFSSAKLHQLLGCEGRLEDDGWSIHHLPAGQKLPSPTPLFNKLEEEVVEQEMARLRSED